MTTKQNDTRQNETIQSQATPELAVESSVDRALLAVLASGPPTPENIVELLARFPSRQAHEKIFTMLQSHPLLGNSFVQRVVRQMPTGNAQPTPAAQGQQPESSSTVEVKDHSVPKHPGDLRFGAGEHQGLGAEATGGKIDPIEKAANGWPGITVVRDGIQIELAPGYSIPYPDVVALAADHFESIDQMRLFARKASGAESRQEIEYARFWKLEAPTSNWDHAAKVAQESRYYRLAGKNGRHFVNPQTGDSNQPSGERVKHAPNPNNDKTVAFSDYHVPKDLPDAITAYRYYHLRAIASAVQAGADGTSLNEAYGEEAFGDHFLTDSFSAGHIRTERNSIQDYWNKKCPMFYYNLKGVVAESVAKNLNMDAGLGRTVREDTVYDPPFKNGAKQKVAKALDALGNYGLGDLVSLAIHDYDSAKGVKATSGKDTVTLVGDGQLNGPNGADTKRLAVEAVTKGLADLKKARAAGAAGKTPDEIIKTLIRSDGLFESERAVPHALPDAQQGPEQMRTLWKFASYDELLADEQMRAALAVFALAKAEELESVIANFSQTQKDAVQVGFIVPLKANPAAMVRKIIDWTPTITDSAFGHNTDDHANDYWQQAKQTAGGLKSLTYPQRERLIEHLLGGAVVGSDEDAIMDVLRSATAADAQSLIARFGWDNLHDAIDNGSDEFNHAFPPSSK
jgi:hypothetical protein